MDSFEFNKLAMAILGTVFLVMSLMFLSDGIFHTSAPTTPGYLVEADDDHSTGDSAEPAGPAYESIDALLASADLAVGQKAAKKCAACHTFEDGGKNKVGPGLYDIVNRAMGITDGFSYSAALKAYGEGKTWTYDELNGFLWNPKKYLKGTAMGFAGVKKTADRAALVAYLRSLSASPAPLPVTETEAAVETTGEAEPESGTDTTSESN